MVKIEQLAEAAREGEALRLRGLVQDWLRENPQLSEVAPPKSEHQDILAISAALVELLAEHTSQAAPSWTAGIGAMRRPMFLLKAARTMPRLRRLCEMESPLPLRRRGLYAPADFLRFV